MSYTCHRRLAKRIAQLADLPDLIEKKIRKIYTLDKINNVVILGP
ncbi:MAG: hypothetical protein U9Q71_03810 [Pseudomonadota bacterium]|nr:hypothetical protein [Pseudomonadota bacterium]